MAAEKAKDKSGYLYPNQKQNERQPDWRGKLTINGKEWLVSGWTRSDKDGMISLSVTDPADVPGQGAGKGPSQAPGKAAPQRAPVARPQPSAPQASSGDPSIDELNDLFGEFDK